MRKADPADDTIIERLKKRGGYIPSTEAMEILGVSRGTLCDWVKSGRIPAVRIGQTNKFDPADLARWLEQRRIGRL